MCTSAAAVRERARPGCNAMTCEARGLCDLLGTQREPTLGVGLKHAGEIASRF
eukprot:CAMPEP_0179154086 /NCGR_PEP_ID=MMETSP0796-20121207/74967_1 /TAXON_ID=73915 /ORGANISM="Pyrodinium bahamense, Strain pbaha01" /LENGTH=52 /DNA_ID=CAMNT_0020855423 /DNA_START=11 /DNA_END=166 /DNA_ORIENTATION=+